MFIAFIKKNIFSKSTTNIKQKCNNNNLIRGPKVSEGHLVTVLQAREGETTVLNKNNAEQRIYTGSNAAIQLLPTTKTHYTLS